MRSPFVVAALIVSVALSHAQEEEGPFTRAEASGFTETSTHADVLTFLGELAKLPHADRLEVSTMGRTTLGKDLAFVIAADPMPADPAALASDKRLKILVNANIHAGEVEGKESVQMILREIARGKHARLLERVVLLFVPNYNPDGNDKISKRNRIAQNGPAGGVGTRPNHGGLDLNRDFVKLESPEAKALMAQLCAWDPHVFMDLHTTNGSEHGYHLTYAPPLATNVDSTLDTFLRRDYLPAVQKDMATRGFRVEHYGNFPFRRGGRKRGWYTYDHRPRFGTNYYGLRNRFAILSEAYSYHDFETRVKATHAFVLSCIEAAAARAPEIIELCRAADRRAASGGLFFGYQTTFREPEQRTILVGKNDSIDLPNGRKRYMATGEFTPEEMPVFDAFRSRKSLRLPKAWAITDPSGAVLALLERHGILSHRLTEAAEVKAERFEPSKVRRGRRLFQGHHEVTLEGWFHEQTAELPAGTLVIPANQRLSRVAAQLLEPLSEDSLTTWNFLDEHIAAREGTTPGRFPILRLLTLPGKAPR